MTTLENKQLLMDAEPGGSRLGRIGPSIFRNQGTDPDEDDDDLVESDFDEEITDEDGDPTGEHDHHQDDNYALGGHVTRSGGL
ncbi:hypothetical protein GCM10028819_47220 [Spirosoma humi]